jgi:acetyl esterase/lipase
MGGKVPVAHGKQGRSMSTRSRSSAVATRVFGFAVVAVCVLRRVASVLSDNRRRDRALRLGRLTLLEGRVVLSALGVSPRGPDLPALRAERSARLTTPRLDPQRASPAIRPASGVEDRNIPYPTPTGPSERLDVYLPSGAIPPGGRPVLIAIHGGGWKKLSKAEYGARIAGAFVARGYVVVAPNYALSAPGRASWPTNLEDLQSVVSWVRTHGGGLGINPDQVVAIGESAGANLAELLGTAQGPAGSSGASTRVNAVIAFSAPSNLPALYAQSPWAGRSAAQFLGGTPWRVPARYAAASPIDQVAPGDPPMLLVHGLQDSFVPASQSQAMAARLSAAGVRNQLILVPGGHPLDFPRHYSELIPRLLEFLDTTWKDE